MNSPVHLWSTKHVHEAECRCKILAEEVLRTNPCGLVPQSLTQAANNLACAIVAEKNYFRLALLGAGFTAKRAEEEIQLIDDLVAGRKVRLRPDQTTLYRDKRGTRKGTPP
jgi:hypothetical protein